MAEARMTRRPTPRHHADRRNVPARVPEDQVWIEASEARHGWIGQIVLRRYDRPDALLFSE